MDLHEYYNRVESRLEYNKRYRQDQEAQTYNIFNLL